MCIRISMSIRIGMSLIIMNAYTIRTRMPIRISISLICMNMYVDRNTYVFAVYEYIYVDQGMSMLFMNAQTIVIRLTTRTRMCIRISMSIKIGMSLIYECANDDNTYVDKNRHAVDMYEYVCG